MGAPQIELTALPDDRTQQLPLAVGCSGLLGRYPKRFATDATHPMRCVLLEPTQKNS